MNARRRNEAVEVKAEATPRRVHRPRFAESAILIWGLACPFLASAAHPDFHVAATGKDSNPGTATAPFATLSRARDAVRQKIAAGFKQDVLVEIRGGTYLQLETLSFGPGDSGTPQFSITYAVRPGERVELSGGRKITGWKKGVGDIWMAELPEVKTGQWHFRQLFVNGRRAIRARTPNKDAQKPWWIIRSAAVTESVDEPFTVTVDGPIITWSHPDQVELICNYNNEGGRKRLQSVDVDGQKLVVAPPHRWNSKVFGNDWHLSAPTAGKPCYVENALEMLDQPGEWYLDRKSGTLSYWPLAGEDLARAGVIAPVVQNTLLAVIGTKERPVVNVAFEGIHVAHVDWPLPAWGYSGLFSCNIATENEGRTGHRFIEAAVEFENARNCHFLRGGIAHVGGMALCLRDGSAFNRVEGNEIWDLGGGGIGVGGCNVAGGHLFGAPPPEPEDYKGYVVANNYIHHVGTDYHGGTGICLYLSQDSVVAHNLVHDVAYCGIIVAGSQDPNVQFAKNNVIEFNHIYNCMKTTVDGAGLYVTFANYGNGTRLRGNLVHDTQWNAFGRGTVASGILDTMACHGLYLDGHNTGCQYENNVVYRNAGGPLLFNSHESRNKWRDNFLQKDGTPPSEIIEVMQAWAGLEPAYRRVLLNEQPNPCNFHALTDLSPERPWAACQFDLPERGRGVFQIVRRNAGEEEKIMLKPHGLDASARYEMKAYAGTLAPATKALFQGTFFGTCDTNLFGTYLNAVGNLPILSNVRPADLEIPSTMSGDEAVERGFPVNLGTQPGVLWIAYQKSQK